MNPDAGALALASIEVDLTPIAEGQSITVMWRGKPVFIRNRTKEEVASYVERDPIEHVRGVILDNNWMKEDELKAVEKEIKAQVEDAIKFAEESPLPDASELYEDVYMQPDYPFVND